MYYPASRYVFHIQPLHINPFQFLWWANSKNLVSLNLSGAVLAFIGHFGAVERKCYKTMMSTIRTCAPAWGWVGHSLLGRKMHAHASLLRRAEP